MTRLMKMFGGLVLAGLVAACGGGGGSPGATPGGGTGGGGDDGGSPEIAGMIYQLSKPTINNSGADTAVLTVTALDDNNNPVPGVPLTVSVDTGVYTPIVSVTGADGQASGSVSIGANKTNRNITANIRMGEQAAVAVIAVTGGQIAVTPVPPTPSPRAPVRLDIKVTDVNGVGVPNTQVAVSGSLGFRGTVSTDNNGNAVANLNAAPAAAGTYTVVAAALGLETVRSVQVVGGGSSGIPEVSETISSASLAVVPSTVAPNASGSTTNRAALRAKFLNPQNQAVQNVRVRFEIVPPALGSGEQISTGASVVYSDSNGEAVADYIPGTRSSPTNGVRIRACFGRTDAAIANGACPNQVTQTLTVAGQPLAITLGDNNLLQRGNDSLTYIKKFDVAVADAAGNAVGDAIVSASVDITRYFKGEFGGARVQCLNEDTNRNGSIEAGEDINGNGKLEPRKADVILSFLGSNRTSATGRLAIQVEYPQNVATWLQYVVRVTTSVAGSEGTDSKTYTTSFIEGDEKNGSFLLAPYGEALDCASPR